MAVVEQDLWTLTAGQPEIDPDRLAAAVERQAQSDPLDFRTRLLIRDSLEALAQRWGGNASPAGSQVPRRGSGSLGFEAKISARRGFRRWRAASWNKLGPTQSSNSSVSLGPRRAG